MRRSPVQVLNLVKTQHTGNSKNATGWCWLWLRQLCDPSLGLAPPTHTGSKSCRPSTLRAPQCPSPHTGVASCCDHWPLSSGRQVLAALPCACCLCAVMVLMCSLDLLFLLSVCQLHAQCCQLHMTSSTLDRKMSHRYQAGLSLNSTSGSFVC